MKNRCFTLIFHFLQTFMRLNGNYFLTVKRKIRHNLHGGNLYKLPSHFKGSKIYTKPPVNIVLKHIVFSTNGGEIK